MLITEGQLRRIIREALLTEGAMTPREAQLGGLKFKIMKTDSYAMVLVFEPGGRQVGAITAGNSTNAADRPCEGAWQVDGVGVEVRGLGPLLYDLMIDLVQPHPLMSDRESVTDSAQRVWDYYRDRRPDIDPLPLDDVEDPRTPPVKDDCDQISAKWWAEQELDDEDEWPRSSLSNAYKRKDVGTPVLDELQAMGMITFI